MNAVKPGDALRANDCSETVRKPRGGYFGLESAQFLSNPLRLSAVLGWLLIATIAWAEDPPEAYRQLLAKRGAPDLETLRERAAPDEQGPAAMESFLDLLKLRDEPNLAAVPKLIQILDAQAGSTRIHEFAAAQALFTADSKEARAALKKHLLRPEYRVDLAIMYASHWEMREPQRTQFIETYLLRDLAKDVSVSVRPQWYSDVETKLLVKVTLQNESTRPLAIPAEQQYQALALHFRAPSGAFLERQQLVVYNPQRPRWFLLNPRASTSFVVALELKDDPKSLGLIRSRSSETATTKALLTSGDVGFPIREYGKYQLSAMFVQPPLSDEQLEFLRDKERIEPGNVWAGRAVSQLVEVTLDSAGEQKD